MARRLRMTESITCGRLRQIGPEISHALKASATAVEQGDWPRVQTIAANARRLRNEEA